MSTLKLLLNVVRVSLGGIGTVVCIAALVLLWIANAQIGRAIDILFDHGDSSLTVVKQRVFQTRDRVAAAKITTDDLEKSLRDWTQREAVQRVAERINAVENTERLASTLNQADDWLEVSQSALELVHGVMSVTGSGSDPADTTSIDQLVTEIESLRAQLAEAKQVVAGIHDRITDTGEEPPPAERIQQAVQAALRLVATLGSLDSRFDKLADRTKEMQAHLQEIKQKTQRWVLMGTIGITLLILWMAAGQIALCRLAWRDWRRTGHLTIRQGEPSDTE